MVFVLGRPFLNVSASGATGNTTSRDKPPGITGALMGAALR